MYDLGCLDNMTVMLLFNCVNIMEGGRGPPAPPSPESTMGSKLC